MTIVVLRHYPALIHAELAKSALAAYDIRATVRPGSYRGMYELLVRAEDFEAATGILGPEETFRD